MFSGKLKRTFLIISVLFICMLISLPVIDIRAYDEDVVNSLYDYTEDTGFCSLIIDDADILSDSEENKLLDVMKPVTQYSNVILVTIDDNPFGYSETSSTQEYTFCFELYDSIFGVESIGFDNAVIFLIDMDTRWLYIYREGSAEFKDNLTQGKCDSITDNAYSYASDGDYALCAEKVFEQIYNVLEGKAIAEPMKVICNLLIGMSVSFLVTYLIASSKSKISKPGTDEALKYAVTVCNNSQIYDSVTHVDKTYCPRSSGGGGGGGHRGGGGHGGGGGHRF